MHRLFSLKSIAAFLACAFALRPVGSADTATVVTDANNLISNASSVSTTYSLAFDKQWTNLPGGTRNGPTIGGGTLATSSDISATARTYALQTSVDALSTAGYSTMNEIRLADDVIRSSTSGSGQSWNYSNYHIAALGTPSTTTPWMLQISGHHLTYNITYNSAFVSATPLFIGTEPPDYYRLPSTNTTYPNYSVVKGRISGTLSYYISNPDKTANGSSSNVTITTTDPGVSAGTKHAPLETQRAAVSALATSIQADSTVSAAAKLSGTFSDVVMGVTNSGDGNFPFIGTTPTYPTGTTGRGVLYTNLSTAQKALVKTMIEAWVNTQATDISKSLLADYESDAALAQTYIGFQVGSGSADGGTTRANFDADINSETTPVNSQNSYIRVDGPRVWIEFVVQAAVAYNTQKWVHYHTLWRDKLSDYGNEFGGYLNTTKAATTYTRPTITTQPTSVSGSSATFTVAATANVAGSAVTPSYQWYSGTAGSGTAISGAASASYTTSTAGSYYVVASTAYGSVTSNTVTLTVSATATAPTITTQPASQSVNSGSSATFTVAASGDGTLSYQWYSGTAGSGTAISGATASSYTTATAGTYYVVVTNTLNGTATTTTSSTATLTVNSAAAPTITTQPASQSVNAGGSVTFTVAATGNGTLTYQWYFAGSAISGATSASYTIASVTAANTGRYYVIVTNTLGISSGSTTSSTAVLMVNSAPTITTQPVSQTVVLSKSATFSVVATGSGTLSYQWYKGSVGSGTAISGATASTYTITQTTAASAGSYYVAVTNSVGTTNSTAATLTLQEPFAAYLSTYGLTGVDASVDSDNDGVSNLVEFVLGGNPTVADNAILPVSSRVASGGTNYLAYSFYTVSNLGSATFSVEYSTDLSTWTTAVSGTGGVTVTTTAYNTDYDLTTVMIPDASGGGRLFARLRATLPSTYTGTISGSSTSNSSTAQVNSAAATTKAKQNAAVRMAD